MPVKEVRGRCKGEVLGQQLLLMGVGRKGVNKTTQKAAKTGGAGD